MKAKTTLLTVAFCLMISTLFAQSYSIDWHTTAGGGNTSTGGVYSVTGTAGQPDAGNLSGGEFSVDGGYWGIIAAQQTPGAPLLQIALTATNTTIVSWPSLSTGFALQQNPDLNTTNWTASVETVTDNGTFKFIQLAPAPGHRFFRLFKP